MTEVAMTTEQPKKPNNLVMAPFFYVSKKIVKNINDSPTFRLRAVTLPKTTFCKHLCVPKTYNYKKNGTLSLLPRAYFFYTVMAF